MADEKISEMTEVFETEAADIFPSVRGSDNNYVTRESLLTAAAGEDLILNGTNSVLIMNAVDAMSLTAAALEGILLAQVAGGAFGLGYAGEFGATAAAGQALTLTANGGTIVIDATGAVIISGLSGANTYNANFTGAYWGGPGTPADLTSAVNRIAAVVSNGGVTPIP